LESVGETNVAKLIGVPDAVDSCLLQSDEYLISIRICRLLHYYFV
jgi:hypothetical protein